MTFVWQWLRWTRWPLTRAIVAVAALTVVFDVITTWRERQPRPPGGRADLTDAPDRDRPRGDGRVATARPRPHEPGGVARVPRGGHRSAALRRHPVRAPHRRTRRSDGARRRRARRGDRVPARHPHPRRCRRGEAQRSQLAQRRGLGRRARPHRDRRVGLVFTVLPGHLSQISDTVHALPFAALGMVLGYAMLRPGALLPAVVVHALLNVATIAAFEGDMSALLRSMLAAVLLLSLVLGTVVAGRRLGIFRLVPVVERVPAEA